MNTKKILLCAAMGAAAVALAIPATGSASGHFYHVGNTIQPGPIPTNPPPHVEISGPFLFATSLGGFGCEIHATVELTTHTAHLIELETTTSTCEGQGALEGCELADHELTGTPTITPTASDLDLYNFVAHNLFEGECGAEEATINFEELTLTVDNKAKISTLGLDGEGITEIFGLELPAEVEGQLEFTGDDAVTWSISK